MNADHVIGALIAGALAVVVFATYNIGSLTARAAVFSECQRDGFAWHYGDRWECRKTTTGNK